MNVLRLVTRCCPAAFNLLCVYYRLCDYKLGLPCSSSSSSSYCRRQSTIKRREARSPAGNDSGVTSPSNRSAHDGVTFRRMTDGLARVYSNWQVFTCRFRCSFPLDCRFRKFGPLLRLRRNKCQIRKKKQEKTLAHSAYNTSCLYRTLLDMITLSICMPPPNGQRTAGHKSMVGKSAFVLDL